MTESFKYITNNLPNEINYEILKHLDRETMETLSESNNYYKEIWNSEYFRKMWNEIHIKIVSIYDDGLYVNDKLIIKKDDMDSSKYKIEFKNREDVRIYYNDIDEEEYINELTLEEIKQMAEKINSDKLRKEYIVKFFEQNKIKFRENINVLYFVDYCVIEDNVIRLLRNTFRNSIYDKNGNYITEYLISEERYRETHYDGISKINKYGLIFTNEYMDILIGKETRIIYKKNKSREEISYDYKDRIKKIENYYKGRKHGVWKEYFTNGRIKKITTYCKNEILEKHEYYNNGNVKSSYDFYLD